MPSIFNGGICKKKVFDIDVENILESLNYANSEIQTSIGLQFLGRDSRPENSSSWFLASLLFLPSESSFLFHERNMKVA